MGLSQFFDDVSKLEERLRQLTSSVDTIDEKQHVGLDISEQLMQQLQVSNFTLIINNNNIIALYNAMRSYFRGAGQ